MTYGQLFDAAEGFAGQLGGLAIDIGDRVALVSANGVEPMVAFLGILAAGATAVPVNPVLKEKELTRVFEELSPDLVLVGPRNDGKAIRDACERSGIRRFGLSQGPRTHVEGLSMGRGASAAPQGDSIALLLQTSGTTGRPKKVPIQQRHLANSGSAIATSYGLGPNDVTFCLMPLFHVHGLVGSVLATLVSGGTVLVPSRIRMSAFWNEVIRYEVTWFSAVPTILAKIPPPPAGLSDVGLRFARSASSALPLTLLASFEEATQVPLVEAYGMTEASHQMASNPLPPGERRPGTVGLATGTQLAVVDEAWRPLPSGAPGEVVVRGPAVVNGYLDDPKANDQSFKDGWFRTGDLGTLSEDGYLTLVGRLKELINRGGEKISPREVEDALLTHSSVVEAVTYGVPDSKYGEVAHAAVVVRDPVDPRELIAHCEELLASFKVPALVEIVEAIPKGPTGKIQRSAIAEMLRR